MTWACTSTRGCCSTEPGTPIPTPITSALAAPAVASSSSSTAQTSSTRTAGVVAGGLALRCATASRFMPRSNSSAVTVPAPTSTPMRVP